MKVLSINANRAPRLEDYPEWMEASAKLADFQAKCADAEARVQRLLAEFTNSGSGGTAGAGTMERARALVSNGTTAASKAERNPREIMRDLTAAREDRSVYGEAITLQKEVVEKLRYRLSVGVCEKLKPEHKRLVARIADLAKQLAEASADEEAFRAELSENGISTQVALRPLAFPRLGKVDDHNSTVAAYLRECASFGYL